MHSLTLSLISAVLLVATVVHAGQYYQQGTKGGSYQPGTKSIYQSPSKSGNSYQAPSKGYQTPSKGGYEPQEQTKGKSNQSCAMSSHASCSMQVVLLKDKA